MVDRGSNDLRNMLVVDGVIHHFAVFAVFDDTCRPQYPELMGNGRLRQVNLLGDVLDAQFMGQQGGNDFQPGCCLTAP